MSRNTNSPKLERTAKLTWVPLKLMAVNDSTQRDFQQYRVNEILSDENGGFDPEQLGFPTVNKRDGFFYICDGQHRIEAYKQWLGEGNWEDQMIQCQTYVGLPEHEEAELFLKLNNTLTVKPLAKFKVAITAGRPRECEINKIVEA